MQERIADRAADLFRALGHPTRIAALVALGAGNRAVGELGQELGLEASTMSQHLAVLRHAGLVRGRREGSVMLYGLAVPEVVSLLDCAKKTLAAMLARNHEVLVSLRESSADAATVHGGSTG